MRSLKKWSYLFYSILLVFSLPIGAHANEKGINEPSKILYPEKISNQFTKPLKAKQETDQDYRNPDDYPFASPGQHLGVLSDSYGQSHYLTYNNTVDYSNSDMEVLLGYQSNTTNKDAYLNIEFYKNDNGSMSYLGSSTFNVKYLVGSFSLETIIGKSVYENDPYIYMRVGVIPSLYASYYSDVTYFKVNNPFCKESTTPDSNHYVLISNESTNGDQIENSGSFKINNDQYSLNKNIAKSAYKMDYVKPFDAKKYKNNFIKREAKSIRPLYQVGDSKNFWVSNLVTNQDYQIKATLSYSGSHSNVWVNNNQITQEEAEQLGKEFDDKIHPLDVENFGNESDVDGNGKVDILVYDIQDGFNESGGYVAGYFNPADLYAVPDSNQSEIFYIDTYPTMGTSSNKDVSAAYSTLVHEFQHMINFNEKVLIQKKEPMDTWMDEGLSMAAEQIYENQALQDRIDYYNYDTDITNGHSLLYWDYDGDTLANYSLSYLFMQYFKIQCGQGDRIFKELIDDPHSDYQAVQDMIQKYIDPNLTFGKFMTDFRAALLLKQKSGLYGFKGNPAFDSLQEKIYSGSSLYLNGGGAVVKRISSPEDYSIPADKGSDVTYTFLTKDQGTAVQQPTKPSVNKVGDHDTAVTGTADPNNKITIEANGNVIGSDDANENGSFSVAIPVQKAGTELHVYAENSVGNKSEETIVTVSDNTAPTKPAVNVVSDRDTVVTGTTEANAKVTVKTGNTILGIGTANQSGQFKVTITKQRAGTTLTVFAEDASGNKSAAVAVNVLDKTPPASPTVNILGDNQLTITGKAEPGATVTIYFGKTLIGKATANSLGAFSVLIKSKQKAGTTLIAYATDKAGNQSAGKAFKVADKTAPSIPTANKVTSKSTVIAGKAESGSTVYVYNGNKYIGKVIADSKGNYKIKISKQKKGTTLKIYAKDKAGNQSGVRYVKVQ
ncbi:Ig-like domain-containing protein [Bacillus smithii]|uniref:Ig-like domain-containing protein n=1 Tax=Bacillus smithii TaxID=1479 RepID=UPI003D212465